jgi:hypothetical protein
MNNGYIEALYMSDKESIVNLLLAVQAGNVGSRRAANEIWHRYLIDSSSGEKKDHYIKEFEHYKEGLRMNRPVNRPNENHNHLRRGG